MTTTLIGYARCSTDKQDLAAQKAALEKLGVASDRIYTDHGLTGTNRSRPGLDQALAAVRKAKSEAKQSMRADVESAVVHVPATQVALVEAARDDLTAAGRIATLTVESGQGPLSVDVVLAPVAEA